MTCQAHPALVKLGPVLTDRVSSRLGGLAVWWRPCPSGTRQYISNRIKLFTPLLPIKRGNKYWYLFYLASCTTHQKARVIYIGLICELFWLGINVMYMIQETRKRSHTDDFCVQKWLNREVVWVFIGGNYWCTHLVDLRMLVHVLHEKVWTLLEEDL